MCFCVCFPPYFMVKGGTIFVCTIYDLGLNALIVNLTKKIIIIVLIAKNENMRTKLKTGQN